MTDLSPLLEELRHIHVERPPSLTSAPAPAPSNPVVNTPPPNINPHRPITAYITNTHATPTHFVICPVCQGRVIFNVEELRASGSKSVYCAGRWTDPVTGANEATHSGNDPHNHWHPSNALVDAGPVYELVW